MQVPLEPATQEPLSGQNFLFYRRESIGVPITPLSASPIRDVLHCDFRRLRLRGVLRIGWRPPLAFVRDELFLDEGVCILRPDDSLRICRELGIAIFTYAKHRNIVLSFDDLKLAFRGVLQC